MTTPLLPILHLNGDTAETLLTQLRNAYAALGVALTALQETAPNGRNYYVQDGLFPQAQQQYWRRMQTLTALQAELLAEYEGIEAQQKGQS